MDTYSNGAYGRIRMFLADLNLVLGCLPPPTLYEPAMVGNFNLTAFQQQYHNIPSQSMWKRPTHRSKAWKKTRSRHSHQFLEKTPHLPLHVSSVKQTELDSRTNEHTVRFPQFQRPANIYDRRNRPQELSHKTTHRRPANINNHVERYRPEENVQRATQVEAKDQQVDFRYSEEREPRSFEDQQGQHDNFRYSGKREPRSFEEPHEQHLYLELLDQPPDSAVNYADDTADVHVFMERPGDGMDDGQYGQAHSDEEINETLDQEESEWDDRSELDIMADSDYFYPFLTPAAPIDQEVESVYSHHDGSKNDAATHPTLTVGSISHREAILQPTLLPMMMIDPELAAPNNNPYLVAPPRTPASPSHDSRAPVSTEAIDPVLTYLDRNMVPISVEDTLTYYQPNRSLDGLPNNNILDSSDHYDFDHHNLYNNNNSGLDSSISDDHYNYDDGQAEDLQDQRAEYEAGHNLYDVEEDNLDLGEDNLDGEKIIMMEEKIIMMDKKTTMKTEKTIMMEELMIIIVCLSR
ncbi:hypothetical protein PSHT_02694 [Puccinia striiformis]|uniref:Uncharacterized protein n=1 Tax=Puccinia striiformis TaxID=27350 RepID=A0A2S4WHK1_9BASI|nr:hypothetical protein PSHT_02694 [Puccinia striiformis]